MKRKSLISLIILTALVGLGSCSVKRKRRVSKPDIAFGPKNYVEALVSRVHPKWFKGASRFNLTTGGSEGVAHFFFDVNPELDPYTKTVNFIATTPAQSSYLYSLDLSSGQHYVDSKVCKQNDIWKKYREKVTTAPYTEGIVPRYLDQLGKPQKIIVFGESDYYQKYFKSNYFDARIVGGVIEQICPSGNCRTRDDWFSRLVLVGVQKGNVNYKDVNHIRDLKKEIEWGYFKAYLENSRGQNVVGLKRFPGFRLGASIGPNQAIRFIKKQSINFSVKKMKQTRKTCYKLYDHIWNSLGKQSLLEKEAKSIAEVKLKAKLLRKAKRKVFFHKKFVSLFRKYYKSYLTCSELVYSSNINFDKDRHWFFAYYTAVHNLVDLGYYFDCRRKSWVSNLYNSEGEQIYPVSKQLGGCSGRDIDTAFEQSIKMFSDLAKKGKTSYRYISYDKGISGTHNKIYSWVKTSNKSLACNNKESLKANIFPADVEWKKRSVISSKAGIGEVIY